MGTNLLPLDSKFFTLKVGPVLEELYLHLRKQTGSTTVFSPCKNARKTWWCYHSLSIALRMAKTLWSFGHSEYNRVQPSSYL